MASHSEVAHRWAQDDRNARRVTGFNMWFDWDGDKNVLYSYDTHFPIAAFVTAPSGRRVCLFTTRSYSISTAKHLSHARAAIPSGVPVYCVERPRDSDRAAQLAAMLAAIGEGVAKAARARTKGPWLLGHAARDLESAEAFARDFGLKFPKGPSLDDLAARAEAVKAEAARTEAKRIAKERAVDKERFEEWQRGDPVSCPRSYAKDEHGSVYVRRIGEHLETSLGVRVPWADAVRVFRMVRLCRKAKKAWHANGEQISIDGYYVDSISPAGNMKAGCHLFSFERMEALAKANGI